MDQVGDLITARTLWLAAVVTIVFTTVARWLRGVSISGAVAGAVICFLMYLTAGPKAVGALVLVFTLTWASTRFGYSRKKRLGTAQNRQGRTAGQVLANLGAATVCAVLSAKTANSIFLLGTVAALSEAAGDTVSSEVGQAESENARMITNMKSVPAGTSGAISVIGSASGIVSAVLVSLFAVLVGMIPTRWLGTSVLAATLGIVADSFLGATLEKKSLLDNNWVNFLSTSLAAALALLLARAM